MIRHCKTLTGAGFGTLVALVTAATSALADPTDLLPGRWTGWGQIIMDGGETEKVKCIATYSSEPGGKQLRHSLRCASTNYTIDAVADLMVSGSRVSGEWQERKYSASGSVSGQVVGDGLSMRIAGGTFNATLQVEASKCKQSMRLSPTGMGVSQIAVNLSKC